MTEKERAFNNIEAAIACGGGKMTDQMRQDFDDVWSGRKTTDQIRDEIKAKYANGGAKP